LQAYLAKKLKQIVGEENALLTPEEIFVYESDGVHLIKGKAEAVLLPGNAKEVSELVKLACENKIPFVPRGAGTGLSGGATATEGGWIISTARLNRILEIDLENRAARVQPGVVNAKLSEALKPYGYHFAPDPSSQSACTVGGNFAENSGGPHCLKYGMTSPHILGVELVLPDGTLARFGGKAPGTTGFDLVGLLTGSEGTLGIATELIVRLTPLPEAVRTFLATFDSIEKASQAVSAIIASGVVPASLEMLDKLTMQAVEAFVHAGYPQEAEASLLIETDGPQVQVDEESEIIRNICRKYETLSLEEAVDSEQRKKLWLGRKSAFGAFGRISPAFFVMDGVVPRSKLPYIMKKVEAISRKYNLPIANVFHAGDGNLHPNILFNPKDKSVVQNVLLAGEEILRECVACGGAISGEHGIGVEKNNLMPLIFSEDDLSVMKKVREVFNPENLCNPGKIFPTGKSCGEVPTGNYIKVAAWI
jgi:glycolate oxidase